MPKLTIIIKEKTEHLSDGHSLTGYETNVEFEAEGQDESSLRELAVPAYRLITSIIALYHNNDPCVDCQLDPNKPFSLESTMAEERAKHEAPFPTEL